MVDDKPQPPPVLKDTLKIVGDVEIRNGDNIIKAKNRFTQTILQHICNMISLSDIPNGGGVVGVQGPMQTPVEHIYLGTDVATPTVYNTTALTTPIGGAPGTAPDLMSGNTSNPSNGNFQISITATWNAGTLPLNPTVGEMALYLNMFSAPTNLQAFAWTTSYSPPGQVLTSRLSVADGSFVAFAIDSTKPLAVTWIITVSF